MKKLLLLSTLFYFSCISAQPLISDNFTTFTLGNIGTVTTGATAGQGGYFTFNTAGGTNGGNSNYQVVATGNPTYGNAFQLTGSDAATGTRFMWKDGLDVLWGARLAANNIIEVEYDFFTGPASTSRNDFRVVIYSDEATPRIIAGLFFSKNATISTVNYTNVVRGLALADNAGTPTLFSYGLGTTAAPQIVFADNTWVRVGFSFNKTSGAVTFRGPGFNGSVNGVAAGIDPGEIDFISAAGTGNTVVASGTFDNFVSRAAATDTLLSIQNSVVSASFSVSPNPTTDFVNITSANNIGINGLSITDINGRIVKELTFKNVADTQVNLSDLAAGMYIMNISSEQGIATKKILKN